MKFKPGDKVKLIDANDIKKCGILSNYGSSIEYLVIESASDTSYAYSAYRKDGMYIDGCSHCLKDEHLEHYESNKTQTKTFMSNIAEKIKMMMMGEPMKTFVKAGIATVDGTFTPEGKQVFFDFLVSKFGDDFKTAIVDKLVAEDSKLIG